MIKNLGGRKLSVTSDHRRSMLRNLAQSLFLHEKIKTTLARAKEVARFSEKLITSARPCDMNAKRKISKDIKDQAIAKKLFEVLVPRYQSRPGGYTQIIKVGFRKGDNAEIAIVKLVS